MSGYEGSKAFFLLSGGKSEKSREKGRFFLVLRYKKDFIYLDWVKLGFRLIYMWMCLSRELYCALCDF